MRRLAGIALILGALLLEIIQLLGDIDFIVERSQDPGWMGDVLKALLSLQESMRPGTALAISLIVILVGLGLIWWSVKRPTEPGSVPTFIQEGSYATAILHTKGFRSGTVEGRLKAAEARWRRGDWQKMVQIDERTYCPELASADRTRLSPKQIELLATYKAREDQLEDYFKNLSVGGRTARDAAKGYLHRLKALSQRLDELIENWDS